LVAHFSVECDHVRPMGNKWDLKPPFLDSAEVSAWLRLPPTESATAGIESITADEQAVFNRVARTLDLMRVEWVSWIRPDGIVKPSRQEFVVDEFPFQRNVMVMRGARA